MDELIVLGTGNAMVTRCYNTCAVLRLCEENILLDCGGGNGILSQLQTAAVPINEIHHLFLSHAHCDHILGAVWFIRAVATKMKSGKYDGELHVYAHSALIEALQTMCRYTLQGKFTALFGQQILFHCIQDGSKLEIAGRLFSFFDICSTKAQQHGFTVPLCNGGKLAYMGDEPINIACEKHVENADWLLSEAFCLQQQAQTFKPYEKHHSTAADAAQLAARLCVKNLLLWHTEETNLTHRKELYTAEAAGFFDGNIYVPDDLERIILA